MEENILTRLVVSEPKEVYELSKHSPGLQGNFTQTSNEFYDDNLSAYAQAVYGQLNRRKNNDTGLAYPGYKFLMEATHLSKQSVAKALDELVEKGWISIQRRINKSNVYTVNNFKTINPGNIQKRKEYSEIIHKAKAGKKPGGSPHRPPEMEVPQGNHGGSPREPSEVPHADTNNTYYSILTVNTIRDLEIKKLEQQIVEVSLKTDSEENRKLLRSLAQSLLKQRYNKENNLP